MIRHILFSLALLLPNFSFAASWSDPLDYLHMQDAGRLKPFDTFARESLQLIYGKRDYQGKKAVEIVMTWMIAPDLWNDASFVLVRHNGVKDALKLDKTQKYFTPKELMQNERLGMVIAELKSKREQKAKLNPYFQAVSLLENQLSLFRAIQTGDALRIWPAVPRWQSVGELTGEPREKFTTVINALTQTMVAAQTENNLPEAELKLKQATQDFIQAAEASNNALYGSNKTISAEVHYNRFHPFQWAWVCYLISSLLILAYFLKAPLWTSKAGWVFAILGLLLHSYGMIIRIILMERPPVTNMYETVVWVPYGSVVLALILDAVYKNRLALFAATSIGTLCLILTDLAPSVLDGSLQPLEPVLRSNFWLSTHVLMITLSYACFFLAFAVADVLLFYYLRDEKKWLKQIRDGSLLIYRSLQVGVVLLAAGTILGGVWADYSWGRFWGWDPKETWALIALLGYLALLHARLTNWIRDFGTAVGSVLAFSLVIMAWYGVNFVLGAGLHSYGFGAGGVEYVSAFVAIHILYVVYVATVRYNRNKKVLN